MNDVDRNRRESFNSLLRPHLDRLFRFACRLCDARSDAEDLFQDVLTKTFERIDDLADVEEPGSWLCRVMYNHFIDNRRRFARQRLVIVEETRLPAARLDALPGTLDPVADAERLDNLMQLDRALRKLSDAHRLAVVLHDCEGYKLKEIQEITGDPVGTIKSRLHRARARLRELLAAQGTLSAGAACKD
jgi:RNA polymerase sigma-70 factor (ECF subfamily)